MNEGSIPKHHLESRGLAGKVRVESVGSIPLCPDPAPAGSLSWYKGKVLREDSATREWFYQGTVLHGAIPARGSEQEPSARCTVPHAVRCCALQGGARCCMVLCAIRIYIPYGSAHCTRQHPAHGCAPKPGPHPYSSTDKWLQTPQSPIPCVFAPHMSLFPSSFIPHNQASGSSGEIIIMGKAPSPLAAPLRMQPGYVGTTGASRGCRSRPARGWGLTGGTGALAQWAMLGARRGCTRPEPAQHFGVNH